MLDAVIGNQDRHHDNWGVIDTQDGARYLAPAFDLASCLGYQALAERKLRDLDRGDVASWAKRGRSNQFDGRPNLVTHAIEALIRIPQRAAREWLDRLASVGDEEWEPIAGGGPGRLDVTGVDRTFAAQDQLEEGAR